MQNAKLAVVIFLYNKDKILVGQRLGKYGDGEWQVPGGHLEEGESIYRCAKRELEEETGIVLDDHMFCFVKKVEYTSPYSGDDYIISIMEAHSRNTPKVMEPDKCASWVWLLPKDIPENVFGVMNHVDRDEMKPVRRPQAFVDLASLDPRDEMSVRLTFGSEVSIRTFGVKSGVPDQPVGNAETFKGAANRLAGLQECEGSEDSDYWIAFESGIVVFGDHWMDLAVVAIKDVKTGDIRFSTTAGVAVIKGHLNLEQYSKMVTARTEKDACFHLTMGLESRMWNISRALSIARCSLNGEDITV